MNRRELLKLGAASLLASQIPWPLRQAYAAQGSPLLDSSPLLPFSGAFSSSKFAGDNDTFPHEVLWNKAGFVAKYGGIPKVSQSVDLLIVGGGIAGLLAAYRAPQKDVLLLEQAERFGGNSKGEIRQSANTEQAFSQGAAYVCRPAAGDSTDVLLKELGLSGRVEEGTPYLLESMIRNDLWKGEAKVSALNDLKRVQDKLRGVFENEYPSIPLGEDKATDDKTLALDAITFEQWLGREFGTLDPLVLEYFQMYAWSSFNASISELSAAQALNFVSAEVDGVLALPGGNAAIAQGLYSAILKKRGAESLRANSFVLDVEVLSDRVRVCAFENGKLISIEAKNVLFAAPKFLARTCFQNLPESLSKSFAALNYRAYLVANVELSQALTPANYDVFALRDRYPEAPAAMRQSDRAFTDIVFADWAKAGRQENPILTIYRPLPFDGARQFLFAETALEKHRGIVEKGLTPALKALGLPENSVSGMRLSRWGHAIPVAAQGFIANGHATVIENAFGSRLQFIGQDVWANPAFETAVQTTERALENT